MRIYSDAILVIVCTKGSTVDWFYTDATSHGGRYTVSVKWNAQFFINFLWAPMQGLGVERFVLGTSWLGVGVAKIDHTSLFILAMEFCLVYDFPQILVFVVTGLHPFSKTLTEPTFAPSQPISKALRKYSNE